MKHREEDIYEDTEEIEASDDTVIGQAFRLSLVAFAVIGAVALGVWWWVQREPEAPEPQVVKSEAPVRTQVDVEVPPARFTDVTEAAGIVFVHENGARGDKLLPETMGGGAAFFDLEDDGDPDLLFVNSTPWPTDAPEGEQPTMALYENDGGGSFTDVTAEHGLDVSFYGMGVAVADADCDGDRDLFFTAVGPNHYFANENGRFVEKDVGVSGDPGSWSTSAGFFDADLDGDLDLFVCNYVRWSREIDFEVDYQLTGIGRAYGPPTNFRGAHSSFYRNEGGTFVDATAEAGFEVENPATGEPIGKALAVRPVDVEGDGDVDLFVANDTVQNFFFLNDGSGHFEERGARLGLAYDQAGSATGAMGIDAAYYRDDDDLGFAIGNFANEMTSFYVSQGASGLFLDEAIVSGIGAPSRKRLSFGLVFLDYDLDGRLDLLQANGHIEDEIQTVQASQSYRQPGQLFWNAGNEARRTFVEVEGDAAGDLSREIVGRSVLFADIDGDGDQDALLTQAGGAPLLLRNDQATGNHWLRVRLVQPGCNPDGIGAMLALDVGGRHVRRDVMPTRSYLAQVEPAVTFGLGDAERVERLTIRWPDGTEEVREDVPLDATLVVERGS